MKRIWLKNKREEMGLSRPEVAKLVNITHAYYSYIENGERRPSPSVAQRIASVLGFPEKWYKLLEDTESEVEIA